MIAALLVQNVFAFRNLCPIGSLHEVEFTKCSSRVTSFVESDFLSQNTYCARGSHRLSNGDFVPLSTCYTFTVAAPFAAGVKPSVDNLSTVDGKGDNDGYDGWTDLRVPPEELRPSASLTIGQCFTWRRAAPNCWVGVLGREVVAIR